MRPRIPETAAGRQFHRAVCETPDDDVPRLIFADWLDENGYTERAEFIRVQLAQGHLRQLCKREQSLLKANQREWIWPIVELCGEKSYCHFSRGFVSHLDIAGGLLVQNARAIFSIHPITSITLPLWEGCIGGRYGGEFFDADLTKCGERSQRVPGPIFAFLDRIGLPCTLRGVRAEFHLPSEYHIGGEQIVSRAAVACGRHQAGLPPLTWPAPDEE